MIDIDIAVIKAFAHSQLGMEHPAVSVDDVEFAIVDPWATCGPECELLETLEDAYAEWGKEAVDSFVEKAGIYLKDNPAVCEAVMAKLA